MSPSIAQAICWAVSMLRLWPACAWASAATQRAPYSFQTRPALA
jgi:hypothetical protein